MADTASLYDCPECGRYRPNPHVWCVCEASDTPAPPAEPTESQIRAAMMAWLNAQDRETGGDDRAYFMHNWSALPGLRSYVERAIGAEPSDEALIDLMVHADTSGRDRYSAGVTIRARLASKDEALAKAQGRIAELEGSLSRHAAVHEGIAQRALARAEAAEAALAECRAKTLNEAADEILARGKEGHSEMTDPQVCRDLAAAVLALAKEAPRHE